MCFIPAKGFGTDECMHRKLFQHQKLLEFSTTSGVE